MHLALERPNLISLAAGFTDNETLPVAEVAALTRDILQHPRTARAALQYGSPIGLPQLRHEILRRWQRQDGAALRASNPLTVSGHASMQAPCCTRDDIIVTNGSQQLLYLLSEALCDPGDIVLVEDPTYFVYLGIVEALGIRAVGVDFFGFAAAVHDRRRKGADAHKAFLQQLDSRLQQLKSHRFLPRLKMLYLVTYFQNPTGHTWPLEAKHEALAIVKHYERAAGHPIYLVEDAAYRDMRFEGDDVPSLKAFDQRNDRVAYVNTLTKPFATGIKLGYGILPPPLMRAVARAKGNHDFGSSNFLQFILAHALAEGVYDHHLPEIAAGYRRKRDAMIAALDVHFPGTARYEKPRGGLYVWIRLDPHTKTGVKSRLFRRALDAGALYVPGEMCYCSDQSRPVPQSCIRLGFGSPTVLQIQKGIRLLANAI
jgi:2-aminoadipate transaminase